MLDIRERRPTCLCAGVQTWFTAGVALVASDECGQMSFEPCCCSLANHETPAGNRTYCPHEIGDAMLYYTIVFLVIALIAGVLGFTGIAAGAVEIARILFFIFIVLFFASLVMGLMRRQ